MLTCSTNQEVNMTLISLSSTPITGAPEEFDAGKVRNLIADYLGIDVRRVVDDAHFGEDLGADWLDRLELTILIEDESGVEINDADAEQIEVVGDLIRHIEIDTKERGVKVCGDARPGFRRFLRPRSARAIWKPPGKRSASK
jgi:acyl carrier protein